MSIPLSELDRAELEKFPDYLRAVVKWDNEHDELPDFAPFTEAQRYAWEKKRVHAHAQIYRTIYGVEP